MIWKTKSLVQIGYNKKKKQDFQFNLETKNQNIFL